MVLIMYWWLAASSISTDEGMNVKLRRMVSMLRYYYSLPYSVILPERHSPRYQKIIYPSLRCCVGLLNPIPHSLMIGVM